MSRSSIQELQAESLVCDASANDIHRVAGHEHQTRAATRSTWDDWLQFQYGLRFSKAMILA